MSGRFAKGQSGNPAGRPRKRRPHVSAFDAIFDETLTVTQNGVERELTVEEGLELQTYQAALKGSKMAIRSVLKMIEKREIELAKRFKPRPAPMKGLVCVHESNSANEALNILGITSIDETEFGWWVGKPKLATWATQAAISRPGRRHIASKDLSDVKRSTMNPERLRWPRSGER